MVSTYVPETYDQSTSSVEARIGGSSMKRHVRFEGAYSRANCKKDRGHTHTCVMVDTTAQANA